MTLWDEADGLRWDAENKADSLLDGLSNWYTSPTGFEPVFWP
jgi:hypothetical protein